MKRTALLVGILAIGIGFSAVHADVLQLQPDSDATIFEENGDGAGIADTAHAMPNAKIQYRLPAPTIVVLILLISGRPVQLPTHRESEGAIAHPARRIDPQLTGLAEKMKSQAGSYVELGPSRRSRLPGSSALCREPLLKLDAAVRKMPTEYRCFDIDDSVPQQRVRSEQRTSRVAQASPRPQVERCATTRGLETEPSKPDRPAARRVGTPIHRQATGDKRRAIGKTQPSRSIDVKC